MITLPLTTRLSLALLLVCCGGGLFAQANPAPTGKVIGRVVDALGEPIVAVEVEARRDRTVLAKTRTDGEGMFVLARLPLSAAYITVHSTTEGRIEARDFVTVTAARPRDTALIRLWDAADISGRVVDAKGNPIAGADVLAAFDESRLYGFEPNAETKTDAKGQFVLRKVPLGSIHVRARADGCGMTEQAIYLDKAASLLLTLVKGEGVALSVKVEGLEADDRMRARVRVLAYGRGSSRSLPAPWRNGNLDKEGNWSAVDLPDLEYVVSVSLDGYVFEPRSLRGKPTTGPHRFVFQARTRTTTRLRGVLRTTDGKPVAGQTVMCRAANSFLGSRAVTDSQGAFELQSPLGRGEKCIVHLFGSKWVLTQEKAEHHWGRDDLRFLIYHETTVNPKATLDLRAIRATRVLGQVVDGRGRPVPFVAVRIEHAMDNRTPRWMSFASATTGQDGAFEFGAIHPLAGEFRLRVAGSTGAGLSESFLLEADKDVSGLKITLVPPGVVEGVVVDRKGSPIPGARVWLRNWDLQRGAQKDGGIEEVLTDREGRYRHIGVEPGGHYLDVYIVGENQSAYTGIPQDTFEVKAGRVVKRRLEVSR